jgi:hypothetical protein
MAKYLGATINKTGPSKFKPGEWWIAIKHDDYDGFLNVPPGIDVRELAGSVVDIITSGVGKKAVVSKLRVVSNGDSDTGSASSGGGKGGGWSAEKTASVVMQSAYKSAGPVLEAFVAAEGVVLGKEPERKQQLLALLDDIALHIYARTNEAGAVAFSKGDEPAAEDGFGDEKPADKPEDDFDDDFDK